MTLRRSYDMTVHFTALRCAWLDRARAEHTGVPQSAGADWAESLRSFVARATIQSGFQYRIGAQLNDKFEESEVGHGRFPRVVDGRCTQAIRDRRLRAPRVKIRGLTGEFAYDPANIEAT